MGSRRRGAAVRLSPCGDGHRLGPRTVGLADCGVYQFPGGGHGDPLRPDAPDNITVLSTAQTLADSIRRIFADDSVSEIFAGENQLF